MALFRKDIKAGRATVKLHQPPPDPDPDPREQLTDETIDLARGLVRSIRHARQASRDLAIDLEKIEKRQQFLHNALRAEELQLYELVGNSVITVDGEIERVGPNGAATYSGRVIT